MDIIENKSFDEERALYESRGVVIKNCRFEGEADGESALKECADIKAADCFFDLRYPFWHDEGVLIKDCEMTKNCRAALWYSKNITAENTKMHGIKALRECSDIKIMGCDIISPEFGWFVKNVEMRDTTAESEYFMMRSEGLSFTNIKLTGKYSFQYIKNSLFENCVFDTKDAFWHAKNVTVKNSVVKGEYLGWYSEDLTLENCVIDGTQPLCCCKGLRLISCEMKNADLCFEKSDVEAEITSHIISVKNPLSGRIQAPSVGEIIISDGRYKGEVIVP